MYSPATSHKVIIPSSLLGIIALILILNFICFILKNAEMNLSLVLYHDFLFFRVFIKMERHDIEFVEELPDHFKCTICTCLLKDPIQLANCGHRFCSSCFEDLKEHSVQNDVRCPNDRNIVNANEVFRDRAAERMILDLQVKCTHRAHGCFWVGEFRHLKAHV